MSLTKNREPGSHQAITSLAGDLRHAADSPCPRPIASRVPLTVPRLRALRIEALRLGRKERHRLQQLVH